MSIIPTDRKRSDEDRAQVADQKKWVPPTGVLGLYFIAALASALVSCFPHQAGPRLAHFADVAPAAGSMAPDFSAVDLEGRAVSLSELVGQQPVVLQLGSHSCPVYRYRRFWIDELHRDFSDRVRFVMVYTREAHPVGSDSPYVEREWDPWINRLTGVRIQEPATLAERLELAGESKQRLEMPSLYLVDPMDDAVWNQYGRSSSPAFVIDQQGRIVLRQVWIEPGEIRQALERLLH